MKFDCIQSDILNKQIGIKSKSSNSRRKQEILTSIGYQTWFYGKSIQTLKEVELLPFTQEQSSEYIRQYCEVSVKRAIKDFMNFLNNSGDKFYPSMNSSYQGVLWKKILTHQLKINLRIFIQSPRCRSNYNKTLSFRFFQSYMNRLNDLIEKRASQIMGLTKIQYSNQKCKQKSLYEYPIYDGIDCLCDANIIVAAFKLNLFTAYDFYETFVSFYHIQQLQNYKGFGKTFNYETTLNDLQEFSLYLALDMTTNQLTQVNYKQRGNFQLAKCFKQGQDQNTWEDYYFDDQNIVIQQNSVYYQGQNEAYMRLIINQFKSFLQLNIFQICFKEKLKNKMSRFYVEIYTTINQIQINLIYLQITIQVQQNYQDQKQTTVNYTIIQQQKSIKINSSSIKYYILLIKQIMYEFIIFSQFQTHIPIKYTENYIFQNQKLMKLTFQIIISTSNVILTKLNNLTFFSSNLNPTQFKNVSIESCNFNSATIEYANWKNIICKEKQTLIGHKKNQLKVYSSQRMKKNQYQKVKMAQLKFGKGMKKKCLNFQMISKLFLLLILKNKIFQHAQLNNQFKYYNAMILLWRKQFLFIIIIIQALYYLLINNILLQKISRQFSIFGKSKPYKQIPTPKVINQNCHCQQTHICFTQQCQIKSQFCKLENFKIIQRLQYYHLQLIHQLFLMMIKYQLQDQIIKQIFGV
ncbi:unnamed protein product [Paramecium sonneborni]|uniref:Transmembrane protein n=1 Tax=Paramecium sonneborni TaxID=65129 RepID=A0A8S1M5H8_9CILI|nr:unnamed protein product [Paramecium sonneborni]